MTTPEKHRGGKKRSTVSDDDDNDAEEEKEKEEPADDEEEHRQDEEDHVSWKTNWTYSLWKKSNGRFVKMLSRSLWKLMVLR